MPQKRPQLQDWIDYHRRTSTPEQRARLEQLLADENPDAVRLSAQALLLAETAPIWGQTVPDKVLERARGIFSLRERPDWQRYPMVELRLLFDSMMGLQPAGLRSGVGVHRETTHQAGELQLSLKVEQEEGTELTSVVGQIVSEPGDNTVLGGRPVLVYRGERMVARTLSGDSGEFQMEFSGRSPLRLVILLEQPDRRIEMELVPEAGKRVKRDREMGNQ